MAAAARLAVAGHRVTVYERTETHGGAVGRFARDGFAFDTGPGLLQLPAVYRDLFVKTGREPLEQCVGLVQVDPASRHLFDDGTEVLLPNASRAGAVAALDAALGGGSRRPLGCVPRPGPGDLGQDQAPAPRRAAARRSRTAGPRTVPGTQNRAAAARRVHARRDRQQGAARSEAGCPAGELRPVPRFRSADRPGVGRRPAVHGADLRQLVRTRWDARAGGRGVRAVPGAEGRVRVLGRGHGRTGEGRPGLRSGAGRRARRRRRPRGRGRPAAVGPCAAPGDGRGVRPVRGLPGAAR